MKNRLTIRVVLKMFKQSWVTGKDVDNRLNPNKVGVGVRADAFSVAVRPCNASNMKMYILFFH